MESNRVIAGTIGIFVVICLVGAVLAPLINDMATTGESITNEGAGWLRMDYTEVTDSSNYSMAVSIAGGTITVTDTNSATQSGADDTIAYASSNLAIWTDSGTIQILGTDPDGDPYYATASASVNVWYNQALGQIIKIDGSEDAITFDTPTWAYLPLTNGNYGFFDNGTSVHTEEGKPLAAVGGGFAGVYAYNNITRYGLPLQIQTTQDTDGLLNGAYWAKAAAQQDQRQLTPITLDPIDPGLVRVDTDPEPDAGVRSVPTPSYTDGDWGYNRSGSDAFIVSYSGAGGIISIPAKVGGYNVTRIGLNQYYVSTYNNQVVANSSISANSSIVLPEGVSDIGFYAFDECSNISGELKIPSSLKHIGGYSFYSTSINGTLYLPSTVEYVGNYAFASTKLTGLILTGSPNYESSSIFSNSTSITEVLDLSDTIDYSVNRYGIPAAATVSDSIGDCLGYVAPIEISTETESGIAGLLYAIPVVILGTLIVVAATTFIRRE